jgi:hypothetical protein
VRSLIQQTAGNKTENPVCGWSFLVIGTVLVMDNDKSDEAWRFLGKSLKSYELNSCPVLK